MELKNFFPFLGTYLLVFGIVSGVIIIMIYSLLHPKNFDLFPEGIENAFFSIVKNLNLMEMEREAETFGDITSVDSPVIVFANDARTLVLSSEVAATTEGRMKGFMHRVCENCSILFLFEEEKNHSFWMKNVKMDLMILVLELQKVDYLNENETTFVFKCLEATEMKTCNIECRNYLLKKSRYYLEVPKTTWEKNNISCSDKILLKSRTVPEQE